MKPTSRPTRRGYVMLLVLVILAALGAVTAALYVEAESNITTAVAVNAQQTATNRAEFGLQTAIARLRSPSYGGVLVDSLTPCDLSLYGNDPFSCPVATGAVILAPVDGGAAALSLGGGLQYSYVIYSRQLPALGAAVPGLLTIRAIGYYGANAADPRMTTAIVEAEVMPTKPPGAKCKNRDGSYGDCG